MKKINLISALALCLLVFTNVSFAQNGRFSVGAELGLPMGSFGDGSSLGIGGSLRYEHPLGDKMGLCLTAGYLSFAGKDITEMGITIESPSMGMIPIQAGLKYYFQEQQNGFYGMVDLGVHMATIAAQDYTITDPVTGISMTVEGESQSKTYFSYAPEIGYHLDNLDFGLRYNMFSQSTDVTDPITGTTVSETSTASYLGIRIAYVFGER